MNLEEQISKINTRTEFVSFLTQLVVDLEQNSQEWENETLDRYLGALTAWVLDSPVYYLNNNLSVPEELTWSYFATALLAAKTYE